MKEEKLFFALFFTFTSINRSSVGEEDLILFFTFASFGSSVIDEFGISVRWKRTLFL